MVIKYGKEIKLEPARRSRRQIEAEEREALEDCARGGGERLAAEAAVAAQIAAERSKWEPMTDVGATLAAAAVGDDGSLVAGAGATCLAMAAAAPMARGDDTRRRSSRAGRKPPPPPPRRRPPPTRARAEGCRGGRGGEERDEEEEADVASFLASVSSRNSAPRTWRGGCCPRHRAMAAVLRRMAPCANSPPTRTGQSIATTGW